MRHIVLGHSILVAYPDLVNGSDALLRLSN